MVFSEALPCQRQRVQLQRITVQASLSNQLRGVFFVSILRPMLQLHCSSQRH